MLKCDFLGVCMPFVLDQLGLNLQALDMMYIGFFSFVIINRFCVCVCVGGFVFGLLMMPFFHTFNWFHVSL